MPVAKASTSPLPVRDPLTEVVQPGGIAAAPAAAIAHPLDLPPERIPACWSAGACHAGDRETCFDQGHAVEMSQGERQRLGGGWVAPVADVGLERLGLVRGSGRQLTDAGGRAAEVSRR